MAVVRRLFKPVALASAWLLLALIDIGVRYFGVGATYRWLGRMSPSPRATTTLARGFLVDLGRIVNQASAKSPAWCLRRALLIWWVLRWRRAGAEIYCDMQVDKGHAWVELGGLVVGDSMPLAGSGKFGSFSQLFGNAAARPAG